MVKLFWVGFGGALGAIFRYLLGLLPVRGIFPFITLGINFAGAVLIGAVVCMSDNAGLSENVLFFLKTGFCGGFTTFSTFSLETLELLERGRPVYAISYVFCSVLFCVFGVWAGEKIISLLLYR